jgi:endonuclease YncB( thermonuclease family)
MIRSKLPRPSALTRPTLLGLLGLLVFGLGAEATAGEARTRVILNGVPTPVVFNDGDSFRVLSGPMSGAKARLSGFNTLESHGAVHQWGDWTTKELYVVAKLATYFARDNIWTCTTDGKTDGYGRMLVLCPELAKEQVRRGYAHAMSIDDTPADPTLLAAQREAIAARRGIWAHGVPEYVLTSLHSIEEDTDGKGVYNRLVSSADGHSIKWRHRTRYEECENVCHRVFKVDDAKVAEVIARLRAEQPALIEGLGEADLRAVVRDFARHNYVTTPAPADRQDPLQALLRGWADAGAFGERSPQPESCMIHVDFKRRFGGARAVCLR